MLDDAAWNVFFFVVVVVVGWFCLFQCLESGRGGEEERRMDVWIFNVYMSVCECLCIVFFPSFSCAMM